MNNSLQQLNNPFLFSNVEIRTATTPSGDVLFCAKDVCAALEIWWSGSGNTLKSIPKEWQGVAYHATPSGAQETVFVNEAGVYRLIFRSKKPKAVEFANWVCSEVLPAIRKQGFFGTLPANQRLNCSRQLLALASQLASTRDAMLHKLLLDELRDLCNLMGRPMPDTRLMGQDVKQMPLI